MHDALLTPIVPPKYNVGYVLLNGTEIIVNAIEPWCDNIYTDCDVSKYIENEQKNTLYNLSTRILSLDAARPNDIIVTIDCNNFVDDDFIYIQKLSRIIQDSGTVGTFTLGNLKIEIKELNEYTKDLIKL